VSSADKLGLGAAAAAMLAAAAGMALYEWSRINCARPMLNGSQAVVLYWVAYLSLFVLGLTAAVAAIVR
jgi:hypothetical protein